MRILVTGSRNWTDKDAIEKAILGIAGFNKAVTVIHGGQSSWDGENRVMYGADYFADVVAAEKGLDVEVHKADWNTHGRAAGPIRNQEMVDTGADICLAFPIGDSRGTRDCMRRATKAGIRVINYGE